MRLERTFTSNKSSATVRALINKHLVGTGYRPIGSDSETIYERGSSTKKRYTRLTLSFQESADGPTTTVTALFEIDAGAQSATQKGQDAWQAEIEALIEAAKGHRVEKTGKASFVDAPRLRDKIRGGANWLLWIAGLSFLNSFATAFGGTFTFLIGLLVTQIFDSFGNLFATDLLPQFATPIHMLVLLLDFGVAGLFAILGLVGRRRKSWPLIVGFALYAFDLLLLVPFVFMAPTFSWSLFMTLFWHLVALYGIGRGAVAGWQLARSGL